jgi:Protein of unknown function (DUF3592)
LVEAVAAIWIEGTGGVVEYTLSTRREHRVPSGGLLVEKLILLIPFVLGGVLVAFGWWFIRMGMIMQTFDRQIASEGVDAEAVITDHRKVHVDLRNGGGRNDYYITFEFTVNSPEESSKKITRETQISSDDYQRINPGESVAIRYLPNKPADVILLNGVHEQRVPFFRNGGIAGICGGAVLILISIIAWLRWPPNH